MNATLKTAAKNATTKTAQTEEEREAQITALVAMDPGALAQLGNAQPELWPLIFEAQTRKAQGGNGNGAVTVKARLLGETYTDSKGKESDGKGNVGVYGLNARFPITLYPEQWVRMIATVATVAQAIIDNQKGLAFKRDKAQCLKDCAAIVAAAKTDDKKTADK